MKETTNFSLKKPEASDWADIVPLNENMDAVDAELKRGKDHREAVGNVHGATAEDVGAIPSTEKGAANGVAALDASGQVPAGQLPAMDYDPAGSAAGVEAKLTQHAADTAKHITAAERTAWNGKETPAGAQAKADTAEANAKAASRSSTWMPTATQVGADPAGTGAAEAAKVQTNLNTHDGNTTKHITASERTAWNGKAGTAVATTSANGLMAAADKTKLNGIAAGANNYTHPSSHPASMITGLSDVVEHIVTEFQDKVTLLNTFSTNTAWSELTIPISLADELKYDEIKIEYNMIITPRHTNEQYYITASVDGLDNNYRWQTAYWIVGDYDIESTEYAAMKIWDRMNRSNAVEIAKTRIYGWFSLRRVITSDSYATTPYYIRYLSKGFTNYKGMSHIMGDLQGQTSYSDLATANTKGLKNIKFKTYTASGTFTVPKSIVKVYGITNKLTDALPL